MYEVEFYKKTNESIPVLDFIKKLNNENEKEKIFAYIKYLREYGLTLREPHIKKLTNTDIWELRPRNNRILFFCFKDGNFVLLNGFVKKTQKTPQKEIDRAAKYMNDYLERGE